MTDIVHPYTYYMGHDEIDELALLDIILNNFNKGWYLDLYDTSTSTFPYLLDIIDNSNTQNYITFIPIEYLRLHYLNNNDKFESEKQEKEILFNRLRIDCENDSNKIHDILNTEFKGIKFKYLKKPYISYKINNNYKYNNIKLENKLYNKNEIFEKYLPIKDHTGWTSNILINETIKRISLINKDLKAEVVDTIIITGNTTTTIINYLSPNIFKDINEKIIINIIKDINDNKESKINDKNNIIKLIKNNKDKFNDIKKIKEYINNNINSSIFNELISNNIKKYIDIIIIPIIYISHFTICIVDFRYNIISFYNSSGYNQNEMENLNYSVYFLSGSMSFIKPNKKNYINASYMNTKHLYIKPLIKLITSSYKKIDLLLFNEYEQQLSNTECGLFIISFAIHYVYINPQEKSKIRDVYNSLCYKGDYTMSILRSALFITQDDLNLYNMSKEDYTLSLFTIPISNQYYAESLKIHNKNIEKLENLLYKFENNKKKFICDFMTTKNNTKFLTL